MKQKLTLDVLIKEAQGFCATQSKFQHKELFGVTDGKAVSRYLRTYSKQL